MRRAPELHRDGLKCSSRLVSMLGVLLLPRASRTFVEVSFPLRLQPLSRSFRKFKRGCQPLRAKDLNLSHDSLNAAFASDATDRMAVVNYNVVVQYHRAGLKKREAIEATTHKTNTTIVIRPTCLDIRSILARRTSASTESLSVV
jgi:hypothetical protein